MDAPIYFHVPSVRPAILSFLSRWFIHAIEARAGDSAIKEIKQLAKKEGKSEAGKRLKKIAGHLKTRNLLGKDHVEREIHFVIADNAAFYLEKPVEETHTPEALHLANVLNAIGNKYGVFVHYITPTEMKTLFPSPLPDTHHFVLNYEGKPKVSPGAACNIALSYTSAHNEKKYGAGSTIMFFKVDDDLTPPIGKTEWEASKQMRNFFVDQQLLEKKQAYPRAGYTGYTWNQQEERWKRGGQEHHDWPPLVGKLENLSWYSTGAGEQCIHVKMQLAGSPNYLIHAGGKKAYDIRLDKIGSRMPRQNGNKVYTVQNAPEEFIKEVMRKSGIRE